MSNELQGIQPYAFVIGGGDDVKATGFVDARFDEEGEFHHPLYDRPQIAAAIARAVADERERCLALIGEIASEYPDGGYDNGATRDGWEMACKAVSAAIRAGGSNG